MFHFLFDRLFLWSGINSSTVFFRTVNISYHLSYHHLTPYRLIKIFALLAFGTLPQNPHRFLEFGRFIFT